MHAYTNTSIYTHMYMYKLHTYLPTDGDIYIGKYIDMTSTSYTQTSMVGR